MNKRMRAIYPPDFKRRAVERAKVGDRSVRQLEQELGLSSNLLRYWVQQYDALGERAWVRAVVNPIATAAAEAGAQTESAMCAQVRELQRQNQLLREDNVILKKAITIFVQEPR